MTTQRAARQVSPASFDPEIFMHGGASDETE